MINLNKKLRLLRLVRQQTGKPDAVLEQILRAALAESNAEQLVLQILSGPKAPYGMVVNSNSSDVIHREEPIKDGEITEGLEQGHRKNKPFFHRGKWVLPIFDSRLVGYLSFSFSEKEPQFPLEKDVFRFYSELILLSLQKVRYQGQIETLTKSDFERELASHMVASNGMLRHQIANDLGLISWWLGSIKEMLGDPEQESKVKDVLSKIGEQIKIVMGLQERLKDGFPKPQSEEPKTFTVGALFRTLKERYKNLPDGIKLIVSALPDSETIYGTPSIVMGILSNLVDNSVQAMPSGGTISIETCTKKDRVQILVRDNGPGIPEAHREKIFDSFFTTKADGSGLGLWLSARMATQMNGSLTLEDVSDKGSTFVLNLPAVADVAMQ